MKTTRLGSTRCPWLLWGTALLIAMAGCQSDQHTPARNVAPEAQAAPAEVDGDVVRMEVPIPVFLVGFEPALAQALRQQLQPMAQTVSSGLAPTARYTVYTPDARWQAHFEAFLANAQHPGHPQETGFTGPVLDGNAIETYLDQHLDAVYAVPEGLTSLVVLDTGLRGHAYHYAGNVGWREPVRSFGEATPRIIWDPHAAIDPWVGTSQPHHIPVDTASADLIASWADRAVAIRALQAPIWPPTTKPCHAITVLLAVRNTSLTPALLGLQSWEETLDIPHLQNTFEVLLEDEVFVDLVVRQLPL